MSRTERPDQLTSFGVVVIGRNEGDRLRACFDSLAHLTSRIVYVDSGSTDGSIQMAHARGIATVALDMSVPFTAARARNRGFEHVRRQWPGITFVQFVDGDCEVLGGWLPAACAYLEANQTVACVCGRLRERFPERSVYNRLCDAEWNRGEGETDACGGIAMMKVEAFEAVGGFNETLIAGEEPELCLRIRAQGGRVWRLSDDMAWHDAHMYRFSQWWRRAMRGGYAAAEGTVMYGMSPTAGYARKLGKITFWSAGIPLAIVVTTALDPWSFLVAAVYPLQVVRLALRGGRSKGDIWLRSMFQVLANFPEGSGAAKYFLDRARKRQGRLIEYR